MTRFFLASDYHFWTSAETSWKTFLVKRTASCNLSAQCWHNCIDSMTQIVEVIWISIAWFGLSSTVRDVACATHFIEFNSVFNNLNQFLFNWAKIGKKWRFLQFCNIFSTFCFKFSQQKFRKYCLLLILSLEKQWNWHWMSLIKLNFISAMPQCWYPWSSVCGSTVKI